MTARKNSALSEITFVAFDVETTGLDPLEEKIVEIGAVRFDGGKPGGGMIGEYQQLVNPERPIPAEALAVHGVTDEMVAASPAISAILPDVIAFFGDSVLIAHNAPFDMGFFDAAFAHTGSEHQACEHPRCEPPRNPILCTLRLARAVFPGLPRHNLEALVKELGIPPGAHHRALADATHAAEVFRQCVERTDAGWNSSFVDLLKYHGAPLRFGKARDSDLAARPLAMIKEAVEKGETVRIEYRTSGGKITTRTISPFSIEESGRHAKVIAFCHLRGDNRTFRLDCIKKIE